jgi:deoxyribose-phosphate aldolase
MAPSESLIEAVTRQVLAELGAGGGQCNDCRGSCAAECSDKVRSMVGEGAGRISYNGDGARVPAELARYIDHTLLAPGTTGEQIDRLCDEAVEYGFAAVCVNPVWVRRAARRLRGTPIAVACVVGFPLGANSTEIKVMEARRALRDGAREIDMVINIGALKSGDQRLVESDIARVAESCREVGAVCKVIIEATMLTDEEGPEMGIKASGGIKSAADAEQMIAAGATRIGASAGIEIVSGKKGDASGRY